MAMHRMIPRVPLNASANKSSGGTPFASPHENGNDDSVMNSPVKKVFRSWIFCIHFYCAEVSYPNLCDIWTSLSLWQTVSALWKVNLVYEFSVAFVVFYFFRFRALGPDLGTVPLQTSAPACSSTFCSDFFFSYASTYSQTFSQS